MCCTPSAMTPSACPPSSTRCAPAPTRGPPPRRTSPGTATQLRRLGFGHDQRRSVATTDPEFFRWTQWIFTQLFEAWYDDDRGGRPSDRRAGRAVRVRRSARTRRPRLVGADPRGAAPGAGRLPAGLHRRGAGELVPRPGHGAVQRGGHPGGSQRDRQLPGLPAQPAAVDDADHRLRRPAAGRPGPAGLAGIGEVHAAQLDRPVLRRPAGLRRRRLDAHDACRRRERVHRGLHHPSRTPCSARRTWCWRRSIRWSTGSSPAPGRRAPTSGGPAGAATPADAVAGYRGGLVGKSDLDRQENKQKTGVFTGAFAINPANGARLPVFIADYVLMGYGTGAIMAVPGQDARDWDFATVVRAADHPDRAADRRSPRGRAVHRRRSGDQQCERRDLAGRPGRRRPPSWR